MADFPNVPVAPGVPPVPRDPSADAGADDDELLTGDLIDPFSFAAPPAWGIYQDGFPAVIADTTLAVGFKAESIDADYQVEQGGFESYDKVEIPFDARVQLVAGGNSARRQAMLQTVAALKKSLALVDVVTPDAVYPSANVTRYDYRRTTRNGVGMLVIDCWLVEIRVTGTTDFNQGQAPSGASAVNGGTVQTTPASSAQQNYAAGGVT